MEVTTGRSRAHVRATQRSTLAYIAAAAAMTVASPNLLAQDDPWAEDPAVQAVLAQRREGLAAMIAGRVSAETGRLSTTFVAHTPNNSIVPGKELLELFARGTVGYDDIEQNIEYAGSHGPDIVVIMGGEIMVASAGANAGKRVHRRFTDVFRRENGEWRHDVRHANVIFTEE